MRRATIVIEWHGPDKAVREHIDDHLGRMFEEMTEAVPKVTHAIGSVKYEAKAKEVGG